MNRLFDHLFPPRREELLVRNLSLDDLLQLYRPHQIGTTITLLPFQNHRVKACVHEAKFHNNQHAQRLLGQVLQHHLHQSTAPVTLIPIPISRTTRHKRGYNQVETILKRAGMTFVPLLQKTKDTTEQKRLGRSERLLNLRDSFAVTKNMSLAKTDHLLIVDDVQTTGATLAAAQDCLKQAGYTNVSSLALSH